MADTYDIAVDFMDMSDDGRVWVRAVDVVTDFEPTVGRHAVVSDDDADPKVPRIISIYADGNLDLEVLPGAVEAHRDVLVRI